MSKYCACIDMSFKTWEYVSSGYQHCKTCHRWFFWGWWHRLLHKHWPDRVVWTGQ